MLGGECQALTEVNSNNFWLLWSFLVKRKRNERFKPRNQRVCTYCQKRLCGKSLDLWILIKSDILLPILPRQINQQLFLHCIFTVLRWNPPNARLRRFSQVCTVFMHGPWEQWWDVYEESIEWFNWSLKQLRSSANRPEVELWFIGLKTVNSAACCTHQSSCGVASVFLIAQKELVIRGLCSIALYSFCWSLNWCRCSICMKTRMTFYICINMQNTSQQTAWDVSHNAMHSTWPSISGVMNDISRDF